VQQAQSHVPFKISFDAADECEFLHIGQTKSFSPHRPAIIPTYSGAFWSCGIGIFTSRGVFDEHARKAREVIKMSSSSGPAVLQQETYQQQGTYQHSWSLKNLEISLPNPENSSADHFFVHA
jgi:hypothetical protein